MTKSDRRRLFGRSDQSEQQQTNHRFNCLNTSSGCPSIRAPFCANRLKCEFQSTPSFIFRWLWRIPSSRKLKDNENAFSLPDWSFSIEARSVEVFNCFQPIQYASNIKHLPPLLTTFLCLISVLEFSNVRACQQRKQITNLSCSPHSRSGMRKLC